MVRFSDGLVRSHASCWSSVCFQLSPRCFAPSGHAVKTTISKLTVAFLMDLELSEAFEMVIE